MRDPSAQRANELVSQLRQLPEKQRAAIVLHYYADRPIRDVFAQSVTPIGAAPVVRDRLVRMASPFSESIWAVRRIVSTRRYT